MSRKEIIQFGVEINDIENRNQYRKSMKPKVDSVISLTN